MDKCREEFEKWFKTTKYFCDYFTELDLNLNHRNEYENEIINSAWLARQHQQAKVEEANAKAQMCRDEKNHAINRWSAVCKERDELKKRVQFLEQELGAWKGKSIAAMINGMCKQCGKEPWQAIVSDKDGYALLHCFGCGANKYELVGEQALNGEGK
ncbi:hypothetical protein [Acinetobacter baumannii]|uniref:hypothetical protein n=1 Tax=Acinetobacter baumannii TaxID=470 RepID=UPI000DE620CA|nr:hypothetical protein [Acinetobacter baumannii]SSU76350.1 Uncharacterised protein [Acinetobacter baumannii]